MEQPPQIPVQEVVEMLVERIASLELEVAVLKTLLNQRQEESKPKVEEEAPETGQYL